MTARIYRWPGALVPPPLAPSLGPPTSPPTGAGPVAVPKPRRKPKAPALPAVPTPARPPRELTEQEQALQDKMLRAYYEGRRPSRNHAKSSIQNDQIAVRQLLAFIGQPLWELTENDFEVWSAHLGLTKGDAPRTQRRKQTAIATLLRYLSRNLALQNEARAMGGELREIAHSENRVVHTTDQAPKRHRRYLSAMEFQEVVQVLDVAIELAIRSKPRCVRTLLRDKAMFNTYYAFGLRMSEGHALNVTSFRANPDIRELGRFGFADVYGKGSNGSGPRFRSIPAINPSIREVLEWYLTVVRPLFPPRDLEEPAMWLSEQGTRLCRSEIDTRFKQLLQVCGIDPSTMSTHGLRHMSVSHEAEANVPLHFTQQRHGHAHASTTQVYTHLPEAFIRDRARQLVKQHLKKKEST
ncbi:tyrosine-type recombinase/integrase [Lysobacter gummosus]|uniref:Tyrosine-type recombinase/integrase n=1 Tax=Lysobacter gummosus TaxID=262324 RepID=A0ABY3XBS5_9GAMM|nr:tyrosine-type recombinase/integrase [Lysobacter gummosus]UNP30077.1 tyrosine-type recombinase/integrase [Lysobacter gummosus]